MHSTGAKVHKHSNTQILSDTESEQSEASELDQSFDDSVYESPAKTDSELLADVNEISSRLSSVCIKGSNIFNKHCKNEIIVELDQNNSISQASEQNTINSNLSEYTLIQYTAEEMSVREAAELLAAQQTVAEDIDDYVGENPAEINSNISKIEELRTAYRLKHNEYKNSVGEEYQELENQEFEERIASIKQYILLGKSIKELKNAKIRHENVEKDFKKRSVNFFMNEIDKLTKTLDQEFDITIKKDVTDNEILRCKNEMPVNLKKLNDISQLIKELLQIAEAGDTDMDNNICRITKNYDQLCSKETYINFINKEEKIRELPNKELFNEGRLKINLSKFSGYESELDIYSKGNL